MIPTPGKGGFSGGFSTAAAEVAILVQLVEEPGERLWIAGVGENKSIDAFVDELGDAGERGGDHRQAAGHGFGDRQTERIFEAGTDISVGRGIEIESVGAGKLPAATVLKAEAFCDVKEGLAVVAAHSEQTQGKLRQGGHRFEKDGKAFDAPVVANEQDDEIVGLKIPVAASFGAARADCGRGKMGGVDRVGNNTDVLAAKILSEEIGGALRNGRQRNTRVGVNPAFKAAEETIVGAAVELAEKTEWRG